MKCPECLKLGLKSTIEIGATTTTAMTTYEYYDEDGKYHRHDPNIRYTNYLCSNHHHFCVRRNSEGKEC